MSNDNSSTKNCTSLVASTSCPSTAAIATETIALLFIFLASTVGNVLIILVIRQSRRRNEWTTNYFVTALAISNVLTPLMCVLWTLIWILQGTWLLGDVTCKITFFFHFINGGISAGLLACISLDRFYVTVHPLSFKMTRAQTKELITFVWLFMICVSGPTLYFYKTTTMDIQGIFSSKFCISDPVSVEWKIYIILFFLVALCFPLMSTCAMYGRILYSVAIRNRQAKTCPNDFRRHTDRVPRTKIKVLRMLVIQSLIFTICYIPYFVTLVLKALEVINFNAAVYIATLILAFSNTGLNALTYALFSADFRQGCKRIICKPDASQAYRLQSLGRKNRISPFEFSSDHFEGIEMRLPEHKPFEKRASACALAPPINGRLKHSPAWSSEVNSARG